MSKEKLKNNENPVGATISRPHFEEMAKRKKGITLIALVISIIVMLILVGVTVTVAISGGLFDKTKESANAYDKAKDIEQIALAYSLQFKTEKESSKTENKTNKELFEDVKNSLSFEGATYNIASQFMNIIKNDGTEYTLLSDGTIVEGKLAYLDIADGAIEIYETGYKQGVITIDEAGFYTKYNITGEDIEYYGDYIITGTTTENAVRITGKGTFNITLKDLNIDLSEKGYVCAFNANRGGKKTGLYVNLYLEGENSLKSGGSAAGLGFANGTPNLGEVTNGSTLTIQGKGSLYAQGGHYSSAIGSGYTGQESAAGAANNIIINDGNITAKAGGSTNAAIGGALRQCVNNIVINGGNIQAISSQDGVGIGAAGTNSEGTAGILKGLVINGGNIVVQGSSYTTIGGSKGSEDIAITGGIITLKNKGNNPVLGYNCTSIRVEGGTIIAKSTRGPGLGTTDVTQNINITGGSLYLEVAGDEFAVAPKSGENNVYLTKIQLPDVKEETQITSLTTSDNIQYGIKDMYTMKDDEKTTDINEDGMLYLYLPLGTRTITVETGGNIYSGTVETKEEASVVELNKQ